MPTLSIWEKETFFKPQDVLIIGSGFTGLWSALFLARKWPSCKITILERGALPSGASSRNAGFACYGSLSELSFDARTLGTDAMLDLVALRYKGLQRIKETFGKGVIDFEASGGYELFPHGGPSRTGLEEDMDYLNALLHPVTGRKRTFRFAEEELRKFSFGSTAQLVYNKDEGALHSGKLLQALLQAVRELGVQVLTAVSVESMEETNEGGRSLRTNIGTFQARQVLLCTNAFAAQLLPELEVIPARGQVLLTSPIPHLPFKGTFHAEEGFFYFRNLGNRVLLGGARHRAMAAEQTYTMDTSEEIQGHLDRYLTEVILPGRDGEYTITDRWAGIMGMGPKKSPILKELAPGLFCAVRMSGMGVALAPVLGRRVAGMMMDAR